MKDAALQLLDDASHFHDTVIEGLEAAQRGEFIEHQKAWANVEKILQS